MKIDKLDYIKTKQKICESKIHQQNGKEIYRMGDRFTNPIPDKELIA